MGGEQQHRVCGDQARCGEIKRAAIGREGDGGVLGLILIEERERAAAGPAAQNDFLIAKARLEITDRRAKISQACSALAVSPCDSSTVAMAASGSEAATSSRSASATVP